MEIAESVAACRFPEARGTTRQEETTVATQGKAPKHITWVICLVLYIVALLAHFGVVQLGSGIGDWSWIVGYAILLIAIQVRGL